MNDNDENLCERHLRNDPDNRPVCVDLERPGRFGEQDQRCAFQVQDIERSRPQYAHGIDGIEALRNALEGIRNVVLRSGESLRWKGEPGDPGFPRILPTFFSLAFHNVWIGSSTRRWSDSGTKPVTTRSDTRRVTRMRR